MPLRKLNIGTYVSHPIGEGEHMEGNNPFYPIATAKLTTPVFDVVHMFSERGISAVPIIDDEGIVVNLYETVDVIVRLLSPKQYRLMYICADLSSVRRLSSP
jgi:signal-transduction protein with cAMP-binding, CBS, and nucleotidyltransferase domain